MGMNTPVTLLTNTMDNMSIAGTPYQTESWHGYGLIVNTVSIRILNFIGTVVIEGSIADYPTENDWASVFEKTYSIKTSETIGRTFEGNWLWIRARLDRSSLFAPTVGNVAAMYGCIDNVVIDNSTRTVSSGSSGSGSSAPVTAVNVGTGSGIFQQSSNNVLAFRSILGANGLTVTQNANDLTLSIPSLPSGIDVQDNASDLGTVTSLNFSGATVTKNGATASIAIDSVNDSGEYAHLRYTSGNSGNLSASDSVVAHSGNVAVNVIDPANGIVEFVFQNRPNPPSSVAILGQNYATNTFIFSDLSPNIATRNVVFEGTPDSPFGAFQKMTLQLRMADTGASAGFGHRAHCAIIFKF